MLLEVFGTGLGMESCCCGGVTVKDDLIYMESRNELWLPAAPCSDSLLVPLTAGIF